ncbi:MAG: hypothetical protein ACFFDJ_08930, partial [Candidatus Odinarchaeota archaeon]
GCPFCTKTGLIMVVTGLALILVSAVITLPWLAVIGLVILLAAYIVPNLVSGQGCHGQSCSPSTQTAGEGESDE